MKRLIQTLLAIPPKKFRHFLLVKNALNPESLVYSLLYFQAVKAEMTFADVTQFPDPLAAELKRFNEDLEKSWVAETSQASEAKESTERAVLSEEVRLERIITLFQAYDAGSSLNLKKLLSKIETLIDLYYQVQDGYSAYALTSLFSAITYAYKHKSVSYYSYFAWKESPLPPFENEKILDVYESLYAPAQLKQINLLNKLNRHCKTLRDKVDGYIEEYIFSIVVELEGGNTFDGIMVLHPDLAQAIGIGESLSVLTACLYDKGKDADGRLMLFSSVFAEENKKIQPLDHVDIDNNIMNFKQGIQLLISSATLWKNSLFSLPVAAVIQQTQAVALSISHLATRRQLQ